LGVALWLDGEVGMSVDESLALIRDAVRRQLGVERPPAADVDPATLTRFSAELPAELDADDRADLEARARELDPWLQGPFLLGGDLVVGGTWRNDQRWSAFGERVPERLDGKRILDVGSNAGYDPFMFHLRGAAYILACEPFDFHRQALFLEELYRTGIDFRQIGWEQLDPDDHGRFDLVHCHGVLYHEPHPVRMLQRLREMLAPDGELFFGSMMLAKTELSEYVRFVPASYCGDPTWWFVPGRLAMRWMLEATGFAVSDEFGVAGGPPGEFPVINGYFHATAAEPNPLLTPRD
jgi:tRNA (mo5U34)-methyltransferase